MLCSLWYSTNDCWTISVSLVEQNINGNEIEIRFFPSPNGVFCTVCYRFRAVESFESSLSQIVFWMYKVLSQLIFILHVEERHVSFFFRHALMVVQWQRYHILDEISKYRQVQHLLWSHFLSAKWDSYLICLHSINLRKSINTHPYKLCIYTWILGCF